MRKNLLIITLITFALLGSSSVFAAPAPELFVINEQNNQCGVYWAGDEFKFYDLPSGWEIYEPKRILILKTPFGMCDFIYDIYAITTSEAQEKYYSQCCSELGFQYVNPTEIPYTTEDVIKFDEDGWKCSPESGKDNYQGILVNEQKNECSALIGFSLRKPSRTAYPTEGQCKITDENWKIYEYEENSGIYSYIINTPFGECNLSNYYDGWDNCCEQLGLENVGRNLDSTEENKQQKFNIIPILGISVIIIILIVSLWFFLIKRKQK